MIRDFWWKLRTWFAGARLERELRDELAFHREMLTRDYNHAGIANAERVAGRRLGNATFVQEETRMQWGFPALETVIKDVRYAFRSLRATPSYTIAATLTLALGIGATVAIFSIVDAVLLRPLPYRQGDELVSIYSSPAGQQARLPLSYPDFRDLRAQARGRVFTDVAFARGEALRVRGNMGAEGVIVAFVSDGLFPLMGSPAMLGRTLGPDDERPGAEHTIVLSHRVWKERYGGDPAIVNQRVNTLDGPYTIVGVMPPSFAWPEWAEAWSPIAAGTFDAGSMERRGFRVDARIVGRLSPGVSFDRADAALTAIGDRLAESYPAENAELTMRAAGLRDEIIGPVHQPLIVLMGAVCGLLLIACANVSNLALARASSRTREIGVRLAIGASRARIARQLLTESAVLALIGGVLGTAVALAATTLLVRLAPADIPRLAEVGMDGRVLAFALGVCGASVLVFGLIPALMVSSANLAGAVREGGRGATTSRGRMRLQSTFVVAEIAVAAALVIGSGLLVKSFSRMRDAHPGFEPQQLISLRIEPLAEKYPTEQQRLELYDAIRDAVAQLPGVERASYINHSPATRSGVFTSLESDGEQRPNGRPPSAAYRLVDDEYFGTMQQRLRRGRGFTALEMQPNAAVAVVNETLARVLWNDGDPIGRRIVAFKQSSGADAGARIEARVVGVVEDIKDHDRSSDSFAEVYLPFPVNPWRSMFLAVRTVGAPEPVIPAVQRAVAAIDKDLPIRRTLAVDQMLGERLARRRFNATIVTGFGFVALLLASFGVYGVVAYGVAQRTQEIGVRSALGASARQLVGFFVGKAALLGATGVVVGVGIAIGLTRGLETMLFGLSATDPWTYMQVAGVVLIVAGCAAYFPARRALRVDPLIAMRSD